MSSRFFLIWRNFHLPLWFLLQLSTTRVNISFLFLRVPTPAVIWLGVYPHSTSVWKYSNAYFPLFVAGIIYWYWLIMDYASLCSCKFGYCWRSGWIFTRSNLLSQLVMNLFVFMGIIKNVLHIVLHNIFYLQMSYMELWHLLKNPLCH